MSGKIPISSLEVVHIILACVFLSNNFEFLHFHFGNIYLNRGSFFYTFGFMVLTLRTN